MKTAGLIEGSECCCPAVNECVPKLCPAIKVASCRKCEMLLEVTDECGCKSTICKPLPTPECPACCKLLCSGTDKTDSCPIFECECNDSCPKDFITQIVKDGECPETVCCPVQTTQAPTTNQPTTTTGTSTTSPTTQQTTTTLPPPCTCEGDLPVGKTFTKACKTFKCVQDKETNTCSINHISGPPKCTQNTCKSTETLTLISDADLEADICCATYQCLPCQACTDEETKEKCSEPSVNPDCGECECKQVKSVVAGGECCCTLEYECVAQPCNEPVALECSACQKMVEKLNKCGCPTLECVDLAAPKCEKCGTRLIQGVDSDGCIMWKCDYPGKSCPAGLIAQVIENVLEPECSEVACCEQTDITTTTSTTEGFFKMSYFGVK